MRKFFFFCLFFLYVNVSFALPEVFIAEKTIDLGTLTEDKIYEYEFSIQNIGDSDLLIDAAMPSCSCIKIIQPQLPQQLSPAETARVKFSFDARGMLGQDVKYIFIKTNDPENPTISVKVSADIAKKQEAILERFSSYGIPTIVTAGLVDGVNPCAFTVLVFFISFLTFVGYNRKQIFTLGGFFILAIFLTYLGIGLGIFEFLHRLEIFRDLSIFIYLITALLAFILGVLSLYDWWIFKKTKDPDKIKLKLPGIIKKQIQSIIRQKTDDRTESGNQKRPIIKLIITALSCGFIVSVLESVCTGQLYLPTIVFVLGVPELKIRAFLYLVLYNLMFIMPLLIIFGFALLGVTSEGFAKIARMHLAKVKLLTAAVFFGLAFSLLFFIKK